MKNHPLKTFRVAVGTVAIIAITLLLADISGVLHHYLRWMARIQFWPAVLAVNIAVVAVLAIVTLLFGRVYCSVICPLGIWQDAVAHLTHRRRKGKPARHYGWQRERKLLRYLLWLVFVAASVLGAGALHAWLEPYSMWGRAVQNLLQPLWIWGNNLLALISEKLGGYAFYGREVWIRSLPTFVISAVLIVLVTLLAARNGRSWCGSVCPVGTTLSFLSRFAMFRPVIDADKCRDCRACERSCKAGCIDIANHHIDYSRCVDCFNCLGDCKFDALHYKFAWGSKASAGHRASVREEALTGAGPDIAASQDARSSADAGRRAFVSAAAVSLGAGALKAQGYKVDGGLAAIEAKRVPVRERHITPPGSGSARHMYSHCTACQLCVAACPEGVLRPSGSLESLMQPESSYERGWCRPECTRCGEVCPAGAILPLTREAKTSVHIGHAVVIRDNCLCSAEGVECGNCARHCPAGAITMVPSDPEDEGSIRIPSVNRELCIGCGACENLCPARPLSAIYVEGYQEHIIS